MNDTSTNPGAGTQPPARESMPRRWRGVTIILLLAALALAGVWLVIDYDQQRRYELTVIIGGVTAILLFLRFLFFSRCSWKLRLLALVVVMGSLVAMRSLFRIQGVTGDLLPIIGWRSQPSPSAAIVAERPLPAAADAVTKPLSFAPTTNDFPQFMGPHRDGTVAGPVLARDWQARPPQLIWRQAIGPAWSGFAILGQAAVTQEQRGDQETVVCYDLLTGKVLWSHADQAHYHTTIAGEGPRTTPTITDNRVFTLGATGILNCLELSTGRLVWTHKVVAENSSKVPEWGMSGSPLVLDRWVIVSAGGGAGRSLVAYDRESGQWVWGGGHAAVGYSSPLSATLAGLRQVLIFNADSIAGHDPRDGAVLWTYPWRAGHPHVALPMVLPGNRVLVSSGYGTGSELLQISHGADGKWSARQLWKSVRLKAKFTNPVHRGGYVYGLDDGIMVCLNLADGGLQWKEGRYGHGQGLLVGDLLLVTAEDGRIVLLEPTPAGLRELTQFQALNGKTWNPPALAGEYLLLRNHLEAACYRLPLAQEQPPAASVRR